MPQSAYKLTNECIIIFLQGRQAMENVLAIINKEVQEIANNLEQATLRINTEFEHAKQGFEHAKQGLEQAARMPQAMCEGKS